MMLRTAKYFFYFYLNFTELWDELCFEFGLANIWGILETVEDVLSPADCQILCKNYANNECAWFNWNTEHFRCQLFNHSNSAKLCSYKVDNWPCVLQCRYSPEIKLIIQKYQRVSEKYPNNIFSDQWPEPDDIRNWRPRALEKRSDSRRALDERIYSIPSSISAYNCYGCDSSLKDDIDSYWFIIDFIVPRPVWKVYLFKP